MRKKNLFLCLLSTLMLVSCGDIESDDSSVRKTWNKEEVTKIDNGLFSGSSQFIPCYAFEELTITKLDVSQTNNAKGGISIKTGKTSSSHLDNFKETLEKSNYKYELSLNTYKYNITETSYLTCDPIYSSDYLVYDVTYFVNESSVSENIRTTWTDEERSFINTAYNEEIDSLLPCYAYEDVTLINNLQEYGCFSLETKAAHEEKDVENFINYLKSLNFIYFENGDFYYKFKDETQNYFIAIQTYLDLESKAFIIDYYYTINYKVNDYKTSLTSEENKQIDDLYGENLSSLLPIYLTDVYEINLDTQNLIYINCLADLSIINQYDKIFKEANYQYIDGDFPYYVLSNDKYSIQASFIYYPFGVIETTFVITQVANLDNVRTTWTNEEIQLFKDTFNKDISFLVPCFVPNGGNLELYRDTANDVECLYVQTTNGSEGLVNALVTKLLSMSYYGEIDEQTGDYTYYYDINQTTYINVDVYLGNDNSFNYDIYYVESSGGEVTPSTDDIKGDITLDPNLLSDDYASGENSINFNGMNCRYYKVQKTPKNDKQCFQFSRVTKDSGYIFNSNQLPEINKIELTKELTDYAPADASYLSVYKSNDGTNFTLVNSEDHVTYNLEGATYFKIINESEYAMYYSKIVIDFKNL